MLSDHIKQYIFLAFQAGGCLLLHESSAESSCMSFSHYFHSAISNHLPIAISLSPEWLLKTDLNVFDVTHNNGVTLRCASKRRFQHFSQETKGFAR